jgi:dynein heavy chain
MDKDYEGLYSNLIVPTIETQRQCRLIDIHKKSKRGLFYAGIAGTGKTTILKNYFATMNKEELLSGTVNFNSYTDSYAFQVVLESNVQKRYGRLYGPPPGKTLLFFIDDINMPKVDTYGTQQPIALIRQIVDYKMMYDRSALSEQKLLEDVMFMACMNPKSGSYFIDLRLQRHFTTVALPLPSKENLKDMYK